MWNTLARLEQDRLDVKEKSRANLFNWRGQFTPQFVDYILDNFAKAGDTVIDPFSGSGTVLRECARKNLACYGCEINPAAYAMSKFFTLANWSQLEREKLISDLREAVFPLVEPFEKLPLLQKGNEYRERYHNLIDFSKVLFSKIQDKTQRIVALNMIFIAESRQNKDLCSAINISFEYIKKALLSLPFTIMPIHAYLDDARNIYKNPIKSNLILTSPPYINVFNYHQNYRAILETLGWNLLKVAQNEFGSNRKNRGNRFKTVIQYCLDMEQSLKSFWRCIAK